LASTAPSALIWLPTLTSESDAVPLDFEYEVDESTAMVRVNPWGSVIVIVSPLTPVTVPTNTGNWMSTLTAVVASLDDT
jgi:hypothetical protein